MTKKHQKKFVTDLCNSVKQEVISKIESGKIPPNWDGFELRELLKEKFTAESYLCNDKRSKRYKEYENTVLCNYL